MRKLYLMVIVSLCLMSFFVSTSYAASIVVDPVITPQIVWPVTDSTFQVGANIPFFGQASYIQNDELTWTSSIDGVIGDGPSFDKNNLSVGTHTILLREAYTWGGQTWRGQAVVTITITDLPPVMPMLTSPVEGGIYKAGFPILFDCGVPDPRSMDIKWYSDQVDGTIGEKTFTKDNLPAGTNKITMETSYGSVSVTITVQGGYKTSSIYEGSEYAIYNMIENILFIPFYLESPKDPYWIEMQMTSQNVFVVTGLGKEKYNSLVTYAYFNFLTGILEIPVIDINSTNQGITSYWARFSLTSTVDPLQFQLHSYGVPPIPPLPIP